MSSLRATVLNPDLTPAPALVDASETADRERRFGGIARLYGPSALAAFERSHVAVIGIGGVGSWAVEALARSAVGKLKIEAVVKALYPFFGAMLLVLALVTYVPAISLWLPQLMFK